MPVLVRNSGSTERFERLNRINESTNQRIKLTDFEEARQVSSGHFWLAEALVVLAAGWLETGPRCGIQYTPAAKGHPGWRHPADLVTAGFNRGARKDEFGPAS